MIGIKWGYEENEEDIWEKVEKEGDSYCCEEAVCESGRYIYSEEGL